MLGADIMRRIHGNEDPEDLKPTKVEHVYHTDTGIFPYVYLNGFYFQELNPWALHEFGIKNRYSAEQPAGMENVSYKQSIEKMAERFNGWARDDDWVTLFGCIDKKIGLSMFIKHMDEIPAAKLYDAFIEIYQRSEFGFEVLSDKYSEIFKFAKLSRDRNKRLRRLKRKIKDAAEIAVFHGHKREDDEHNPQDHYSWTLDENVAVWFAKRYGTPGEVWSSALPVADAVDYLTDRNEAEILIDYAKMDRSREVRRDAE